MKKNKHIFLLSIMLFLCMVFAPPKVQAQTYIPVDSIVLGIDQNFCPDGKSICVAIGDERVVVCVVHPWNATNNGLTYESMNMDIVTVEWDPSESHAVKLHTHSVGETDIIVRSLDSTYTGFLTVKIRVLDIEQGQLKLSPKHLEIVEGDYQYISTLVENPEIGANYHYTGKLKWEIDDSWVADVRSVEGYGEVTAKNYYQYPVIITARTANNVTATGTVTVKPKPPAAPRYTPCISLISGNITRRPDNGSGLDVREAIVGTQIKIVCTDATGIKYTIDGTDPTINPEADIVLCNNGSPIITLREQTTIRAVAYNSDPHYTIYGNELKVIFIPKLSQPFFVSVPKRGVYEYFQYGDTIKLQTSNTMPGVKILYTTDGSEPNMFSPEYKKPIPLDGYYLTRQGYFSNDYEVIIQAKAFCDGYEASDNMIMYRTIQYDTPIINAFDGRITSKAWASGLARMTFFYTLSDDPNVRPDQTSTKYYGAPISKEGITDFKYLTVVAINTGSNKYGKMSRSKYAQCKYYNKTPDPQVTLYNFKTQKWTPSPKTDFVVAFDDSIKLAVPDYPTAKIKFSNVTPPTNETGEWWNDYFSYKILKNEKLYAKSYIDGTYESKLATFNFNIMTPPKKPEFSVTIMDPTYGTPLTITGDGVIIGLSTGTLMTDDGTDPYIYRNKDGNVEVNGYYIENRYNNGNSFNFKINPKTWKTDSLKIVKSGTYKAINYQTTPDGSFVMSAVSQQQYLLPPRKARTDVDKGEAELPPITGPDNEKRMGLLGKIIKFAMKGIECISDPVTNEETKKLISYLPICDKLKDQVGGEPMNTTIKQKAYPLIKKGLSFIEKEAKEQGINTKVFTDEDLETFKKYMEPYKYSTGGDGFSFNVEAGGILAQEKAGAKDWAVTGGMYLKGDAKAKAEGSTMFGPFQASYKIKVEAGFKAGLSLKLDSLLSNLSGEHATFVTKTESFLNYFLLAEMGIGFGIPYLASLEIHARARLTHEWIIHKNKHRVMIGGKVWAVAKFLLFDGQIPMVEAGAELFNNGYPGKSSGGSDLYMPDITDFTKMLIDPTKVQGTNQWKILPRKYLEKQSKWLGSTPPERDGSEFRVLQEAIYSETEPKIAEGGGKRVMVFLADDPSKDDYNRTRLMSSVYNSATDTWSDPVPVNNSGRADFYPCIASNGTDIWVTWQNSKTLFTSSVTPEEMFAAGEIALAKFNPSTNKFNPPTMLTNNSIADGAPKLTVTPSGSLSIAWIQNASNDPFSATQTNKIMEARHNGSTLQGISELTTVQGPVYDLDVAQFNSKVLFAYTTLGDSKEDNLRNFYTMELGSTTPQKIVSDKLVSGVRYSAMGNTKVLSWLEDEKLRYLPQGGTPQNFTDSADMLFENYKIFTNGTKTAVVYPSTEDGFGYLFARNIESGKMGNPYKLVTTKTGVAFKFDGLLENTGEFYIVYNSSVSDLVDGNIEEENTLMTFRRSEPVNLRLKYLDYSQEEVKLGKPLKVGMDIANIGGVTINNVVVKVNGTAAGTYPLNLKPGEEKRVDFNMNIPSTMTPRTMFKITIEPAGLTDFDMNDNTSHITLGFVDFTIRLTPKYKNGNKVTITANITNESDFAANTQLIVRHGAEDGPVLDFIDIGNFAARAVKEYHFNYDLDDICQPGELEALYFNLISDKDAKYNGSRYEIVENLAFTVPYDSVPGVGIKDPKPTVYDNNSVLVYPNPTTGEVKVVIVEQGNNNANIETVDVYDMFGRRILSHSADLSPYTSFNVTHLQSGIYFLRIKTDNNLVVKKLIKY